MWRAVWLGLAIGCGACGRVWFDPIDRADAPPAPPDAAASACSTDPGLAACYAFEGDTTDSTANANDGTPTAVAYVPGRVGMAAVVGMESAIRVEASASLQITTTLTVEAWIRPVALPPAPTRAVIFDRNDGYALWLTDLGQVKCGLFVGGTTRYEALTPPLIATDTWRHLACTYDGTTVTVWVDGVSAATGAGGMPLNTTADQAQLGGNAPDGANPNPDRFEGLLDQLRIWNAVRTPAELCAAAESC